MGRKITVIILDSQSYDVKIMDEDEPIISNFPAKEFLVNRKDGLDLAIVHRAILRVCPVLREAVGPFRVSSVLRTILYNLAEGGTDNSDHTKFNAFDFDFLRPLTLKEQFTVVLILGNYGFKSVGVYKNKYQFHASIEDDKINAWEG